MKHFAKIATGIDVGPLLQQLDSQPELWDQHPVRTEAAMAFSGTSDIWVRYNDYDNLNGRQLGQLGDFNGPHFPVWYPAYYRLPALRPILFYLQSLVGSVHLGGVLITRIPAGHQVKPHVDAGWHAEWHNVKVYLPLRSNPLCVNTCGDEAVTMAVGEAWTFDNLTVHSVVNGGPFERLTLISCMRVE
jgi:hypothetical protein